MAASQNRSAACPICGKPMAQVYRPFCSKRCADVDLNRWLTGRYAVPAIEDEADADDMRMATEGKGERTSGQGEEEPL